MLSRINVAKVKVAVNPKPATSQNTSSSSKNIRLISKQIVNTVVNEDTDALTDEIKYLRMQTQLFSHLTIP